jgi:hypothetical protein
VSGEITGFPTLTARGLIAAAAVTFRARWRRVLAVGALVAAIAVVLDEALDRLVEAQHDNFPMWIAILLVGLAVLTSGANSFGSVFLSGLLDKTVGEHQHGHDHVRLSKLLVTLPFITLIGADLVVTVMRGLGALFFLIPGIIVVTLTCVTGPVVIIEGRRALPAIGRSIRLTSGAFWLTFRAVTILMVAETLIDELLTSFAFAHNFFGHFGVAVVVEVPIALFVSLVEVTLAYQLIARDRASSRGAPSENR